MPIAKMSLVQLRGDRACLDEALLRCVRSSVFHPENASALGEYARGVISIGAENRYRPLRERTQALAAALGIRLGCRDFDSLTMDGPEMEHFIAQAEEALGQLQQERRDTQQLIASHEGALVQLGHLHSFQVSFDELFACEFVEIRFGRLPEESYAKLRFYQDKPFLFFSFDDDGEHHWCMYICAGRDKDEIDGLFAALYFQRLRIPDYAHGTPESARAFIEENLKREKEALAGLEARMAALIKEKRETLEFIDSKLLFWAEAFEMHRFSAMIAGDGGQRGEFVLMGFVPQKEEARFRALFDDLPQVGLTVKPPEDEPRLTPPVQLKNGVFAKPFEMFTQMYGVPSYRDIDPTPLVAITYTFLFGVMFGDVGQGLLVALLGFWLGHRKGMPLGRIIARTGIFSAVMGLFYGSVFGFEELLDPLYHALGLAGKPLDVLRPASTMAVLGGAVAMGAVLILMAMAVNVVLGLRQGNMERAIFSQNGLAGLWFYGSVLYAAANALVWGKQVTGPVFYLVCVALPLCLMFLKEPLGRLAAKKKGLFHDGVVNGLVASTFEMVEILLSFVSNTLSFLRIGGFVLSHAGMMLVVMSLTDMVGRGASPLVIVFGNALVIGLEGLLVGIQVLRLEFFEIFSRFFEGDGKPYAPVRMENCQW